MRIAIKTFIIFVIFILTVFCFLLKVNWAAPAQYNEIKNLTAADQGESPAVIIEVPQVEYNATSLRDPFDPEPLKEEDDEKKDKDAKDNRPQLPLPNLVVQGIVWGAELSQAIINNQVVKVGDQIEGVRIVGISKDGIIVFYGGRKQLIAAPAVNMLGAQSFAPKEE